MHIARQLRLQQPNIDVNEAWELNRETRKQIAIKQERWFSIIKFDVGIYIFAMFQLGLTNLIVYKRNFKFMDMELIVFSVIMLARRIIFKSLHYHQVNIYRLNMVVFSMTRVLPLTLMLVLLWLLFKITLFNSVVNVVCILFP